MAKTETKLDRLLKDFHELEDFLHALIPVLDAQKLRQDDDVLPYAKELKLKIPESLKGLDITWEAESSDSPQRHGIENSDGLVLVRSGHADVLGFTVGCVKIGKNTKACLECGWLYCRVVIKGRF